jgi:phosphopantetheine--protein transferase-like protein
MVIRNGIDLVKNERILKNLNDPRFLKKVFHPSELKQPKKLVGIFTLKEATMKAIGKKINWLDIEVKTLEGKKPEITIKNIKNKSIDCSISHDGDYTIGIVVIEL